MGLCRGLLRAYSMVAEVPQFPDLVSACRFAYLHVVDTAARRGGYWDEGRGTPRSID